MKSHALCFFTSTVMFSIRIATMIFYTHIFQSGTCIFCTCLFLRACVCVCVCVFTV